MEKRIKTQKAEKRGRISLDVLQAMAEQTEREAEEEKERIIEQRAREKAERRRQQKNKRRFEGVGVDEGGYAFKLVVAKAPAVVSFKDVPEAAQVFVKGAAQGSGRVRRVQHLGLSAPRTNKPAKFFVRR